MGASMALARPQLTNAQKLKILKERFGPNVMCTNGLFHFFDDQHNEIYIDPNMKKVDNRGKYKTLVVLDYVVVAECLTSYNARFVVLRKDTFNTVFRTRGKMIYIDDFITCAIEGSTYIMVSHTGRILGKFNEACKVVKLANGNYLVSSRQMYNDKIIYYDTRKDKLINLTEGKRYAIIPIDENLYTLEIVIMNGGRYMCDILKKTVYNCFTCEIEKRTQLWEYV